MYEVHGATVNLNTFSDSCARRPLLMLQSDLLQRHEVVRQLTPPLEYCSVRALEDKKRGKEVRKGLRSWTDAAQLGCQGLKAKLCVHVCYIAHYENISTCEEVKVNSEHTLSRTSPSLSSLM